MRERERFFPFFSLFFHKLTFIRLLQMVTAQSRNIYLQTFQRTGQLCEYLNGYCGFLRYFILYAAVLVCRNSVRTDLSYRMCHSISEYPMVSCSKIIYEIKIIPLSLLTQQCTGCRLNSSLKSGNGIRFTDRK